MLLANSLRRNKTIAHLSIKDNPKLTDVGIEGLNDVIMNQNMILFQIDFDKALFNEELGN